MGFRGRALPGTESTAHAIAPTKGIEHFAVRTSTAKGVATVVVEGELDKLAIPDFQAKLREAGEGNPDRVVINMKGLKKLDPAAVRALIFAKQKMSTDEDVEIVGASKEIKDILNATEFGESVRFTD